MPSAHSAALLVAASLHDAGFTRNEAGKLLRLTFPEVKSRSIADKLTKLYGRSYSRVSVVPNALFYLTSPPPERLLEGELREETRRNALARLRKATQSFSADGTVLTYEAADSSCGSSRVAVCAERTIIDDKVVVRPCADAGNGLVDRTCPGASRSPLPPRGVLKRASPTGDGPLCSRRRVSFAAGTVQTESLASKSVGRLLRPGREQLWWTAQVTGRC